MHKIERTCIVCRGKFSQKTLLRLQCKQKKLIAFSGSGRSFYLCEQCISDTAKVEKALYRNCKNKANYIEKLEEIVGNG